MHFLPDTHTTVKELLLDKDNTCITYKKECQTKAEIWKYTFLPLRILFWPV